MQSNLFNFYYKAITNLLPPRGLQETDVFDPDLGDEADIADDDVGAEEGEEEVGGEGEDEEMKEGIGEEEDKEENEEVGENVEEWGVEKGLVVAPPDSPPPIPPTQPSPPPMLPDSQPMFEHVPCFESGLPPESYCALCASRDPESPAPEQPNEEVVEIEETPEKKQPLTFEEQQRMIKSLERKLGGAHAELAQVRKEDTSRNLSIPFSLAFFQYIAFG